MSGTLIVTGGSRGIGAAVALEAARAGWAVAVNYLSNAAAAARVVAEIEAGGGRAAAIQADASEEAEIERLFDEAEAGLGPLGGLVNNAGIIAPVQRLDEMETARLERMFRTNVLGPFLCARAAVKRLSTRHGGKGGVIVNLSSAAARIGSPGQFVDYAASKGAIDTFTYGLALEVAKEGIRVNAVRPGLIDTEIHAAAGLPTRVADLGGGVPLGRGGSAQEVADAICYLLSEKSSYITGVLLDVSGGR